MDTKLDYGRRGDCGLFYEAHSVPSLKLTSFTNWLTARPIQFDVTCPPPDPSLKLTSFSNWRTARPIQFDVTFSTPVP